MSDVHMEFNNVEEADAIDYITFILSKRPKDVDAKIFIDADRPNRGVSWQQWMSNIPRIAAGLQDLGLKEQDGVGLISRNDIYYYNVGDGVIAAGGVFAGISFMAKKAEIVQQLAVGDIQYLLASPEFLDLALDAFIELGRDASRVLVYDPPGLEAYTGDRASFSKLLQSTEWQYVRPTCLDDPAQAATHRLFTSGTTGLPKACQTTHSELVLRCRGALSVLNKDTSIRFFHQLAMFHPSGLFQAQYAVIGLHVVYLSSVSSGEAIMDKFREHSITNTFISPRTIDLFVNCVESGLRPKEAFATLRKVLLGGSKARLEAMTRMQDLLPEGAVMVNAYGSTETYLVAMAERFPVTKPPSVGKPATAAGVEVKIIDPDSLATLPPNQHGEIIVRSPMVFTGYFRNPSATALAFIPATDSGRPWFRTGDQGHLSSTTGELAITGRYKEIFKVWHEEVAPAEVEAVIELHPGVLEAAVTSIPSRGADKLDNEVLAYVARKSEGGGLRKGETRVTAQEIVQWVADRLARYKVPTGGVRFVEYLPRNALAKVVKRDLEGSRRCEGSRDYLDFED